MTSLSLPTMTTSQTSRLEQCHTTRYPPSQRWLSLQYKNEATSTVYESYVTFVSTQLTENSTSNSEERARGKLLSTQSEPAVTAIPCNGEDKGSEDNIVTAADEGIHEDENGMGF